MKKNERIALLEAQVCRMQQEIENNCSEIKHLLNKLDNFDEDIAMLINWRDSSTKDKENPEKKTTKKQSTLDDESRCITISGGYGGICYRIEGLTEQQASDVEEYSRACILEGMDLERTNVLVHAEEWNGKKAHYKVKNGLYKFSESIRDNNHRPNKESKSER